MRNMRPTFVFIAALSAMNSYLVQNALAGPITFSWEKAVQIEVTFVAEADVTGTELDKTPSIPDNLFVYSVTNPLWEPEKLVKVLKEDPVPCLPPCHVDPGVISAFRVADPDHLGGVILDVPEGWSGSVSDKGFVWEATEAHGISQGETLKFYLYSPGPYGISTGQATFGFKLEARDVSGPVSGPLSPGAVPEPSTLLLLGSGLLAAGRRLRPHRP